MANEPVSLARTALTCLVLCNLVLVMVGLLLPSFGVIRLIYDGNTLVAPLVLGVVAMLAARARRWRSFGALAALALLGVATRGYATHFEPRRLMVREVRVPTSKVHAPLRIVHVSDIQSDEVGAWERRVADRIAAEKPDLVVHTGDLLHPISPATVHSELPVIERALSVVRPPLGFFTVDGDVDGWMRGTEVAGMRRLHDEAVTLEHEGRRVHLLGLSLEQSRGGPDVRARVLDWLDSVGTEELTIVLGHRPDFILSLTDVPIDLALAGHTHGGQIRLPWVGPPITLSAVPRDWARGHRWVGRTLLNVSAGVGNEHAAGLPALRINCPPELTAIDLSEG